MDERKSRRKEIVAEVTDCPEDREMVDETGGLGDLLIGWVDAPRDRSWELEDYGIDLSDAHWDPETERWEGCLFTEDTAELLVTLFEEKGFPYCFEAGPCEDATARQPRSS